MKLSFSLALLAAAALSVQAAVTPNPAGTCISGSSGKNNGDGYNGFCCKTSDDCFESCVKGVCNGPAPPTKTSATPTPTGTPGTCIKGSSGLGEGNGYNGYCCESSDDCFESCVKGVCNGPAPPTKTSSTPTPTGTPGTCIKGSSGLGEGNGYNGYCCKTSDDCFESCVKGVCNGPAPPSKTSSTPVPTGGAECKAGFKGKKNGQGPKDACCSTEADCQEDCVKGKCT